MASPLLDKPTQDQRIVQHGRTWRQFKLIQEGFANSPGVRLFYYKGIVEILSVGSEHEIFKTLIGLLIETFFVEKGIEFTPTGSMSQEREGEVSVQADESYCIGDLKPVPDLSIEVVFSSGGPDKLERYRALGVSEVWFWEDGLFTWYRLGEQGYERIDQSELLPDLDINLLARCVLMSSRVEAVREFRKAIAS
jgi:Uma2 family endonuclease